MKVVALFSYIKLFAYKVLIIGTSERDQSYGEDKDAIKQKTGWPSERPAGKDEF